MKAWLCNNPRYLRPGLRTELFNQNFLENRLDLTGWNAFAMQFTDLWIGTL